MLAMPAMPKPAMPKSAHRDACAALLRDQAGVVARRQVVDAGLMPHDVQRKLRRREWATIHPGVYIDHTGPPTWLQRAWAAVLATAPSALAGESALRAADGPGRRDHDERVIHVAVERARHLTPPPGIVVHRTSRLDQRILANLSPPRMRYEEAVLDVAGARVVQGDLVGVVGALTAAVQSRRTTAVRLLTASRLRPRAHERAWTEAVLSDLATGATSVLEHGFLTRVERPHRLPTATRQVRSVGTLGLAYRDAAFDGMDVELDGRQFHDTTEQRDRDLDRDLDAAVAGRSTVRLGYGQVFARPCATAWRLGAMLQARGWAGAPGACGPTCVVRANLPSAG